MMLMRVSYRALSTLHKLNFSTFESITTLFIFYIDRKVSIYILFVICFILYLFIIIYILH